MWLPRLASIGFIIVGIIGLYVTGAYIAPEQLNDNNSNLSAFTMTLYFGFIFLGVSGVGGVIASLGYELDEHGQLRPRDTILGRRLVKMTGDAQTFCGISVMTGLICGFITVVSFVVGLITYLIASGWNQGGAEAAAKIAPLVIGGALMWALAYLYPKAAGKTITVTGMAALGILFAFGFFKLFFGDWHAAPFDWQAFLASITFVGVGIGLAIAFGVLQMLATKLKIYSKICPVRPPPEDTALPEDPYPLLPN